MYGSGDLVVVYVLTKLIDNLHETVFYNNIFG